MSLYVAGRRCVVVGDGPEADDRVRRLTDAGAEVVRLPAPGFDATALDGASMVFACDAGSADEVARLARERGVMVYALDRPELSDLAMPALARREPVSIAIATDGVAPALAARLRAELQRLLDECDGLDAFVDELVALRAATAPGADRRARLKDAAERLVCEGRLRIADP